MPANPDWLRYLIEKIRRDDDVDLVDLAKILVGLYDAINKVPVAESVPAPAPLGRRMSDVGYVGFLEKTVLALLADRGDYVSYRIADEMFVVGNVRELIQTQQAHRAADPPPDPDRLAKLARLEQSIEEALDAYVACNCGDPCTGTCTWSGLTEGLAFVKEMP